MGSAARLTYDDLLALSEDDGKRRELFDGALVVTPSPHGRHQFVLSQLYGRIDAWGRDRGWISMVGPVDLVITPRDVLAPDIVALRPDHPYRFQEGFLSDPPDLVVEVASPRTRRRDQREKVALYARFGVTEYWFVDHERGAVTVHRLDCGQDAHETFIGEARLTSTLLPGFSVIVSDLCAIPR